MPQHHMPNGGKPRGGIFSPAAGWITSAVDAKHATAMQPARLSHLHGATQEIPIARKVNCTMNDGSMDRFGNAKNSPSGLQAFTLPAGAKGPLTALTSRVVAEGGIAASGFVLSDVGLGLS